MRMMAKLAFLFLTVSMAVLMMPPTIARAASSQADTLVQAFPTLDELEAHLGIPPPLKARIPTRPRRRIAILPTWVTSSQ